ncbi:AMP-binding protein [Leptolyngbya iicbica]|nr:AMP-binding protein [Leptolyngbya sp. LK]
MTPSEILQRRWGEPWLVAAGADTFWPQLAQWQHQLQHTQPRDLLLAEPDPIRLLAAFFAAAQRPCRIWLANPQWGTQEWSQVAAQCQPDLVIGTVPTAILRSRQQEKNNRQQLQDTSPIPLSSPTSLSPPPSSPAPQLPSSPTTTLHIPTGGSSGNIQFATHTWETLAASVWGFCRHFDCDRTNAYCLLPLYHVSGLMQAMRCLLSGGRLVIQPFRELLAAQDIEPLTDPSFLSLVPTQLQRLLASDHDFTPWLRQFTAILLGGAPPWPSLLQTARHRQLPLAPTYGMTETASQVATLLPQEFLAGHAGSGRSLPHAHLSILDEAGDPLPSQQVGRIAIAASSLALTRGATPIPSPLLTGDLGYLDAAGFLHVVGRETTLIFTGGEKVLPQEVEAAMLATGLVQDCAVLGVPDTDWGERVVAVITTTEPDPEIRLRSALQAQLSPYKMPKRWLVRAELPRNAQGKLNRAALRQWVMSQLGSTAATTGSALASGDGADG